MKISANLVHQNMAIFFNFSLTSSHLHPLQVENCGNSRLVVDEDDNGKVRIERVNQHHSVPIGYAYYRAIFATELLNAVTDPEVPRSGPHKQKNDHI